MVRVETGVFWYWFESNKVQGKSVEVRQAEESKSKTKTEKIPEKYLD